MTTTTTAREGNSAAQQVSDIFRQELTPAQVDGVPADEEVTETEQVADSIDEDPDAQPDESLEEGTEEEQDEQQTAAEGEVEIRDLNTLAEQIGVDMPYLYDLEIKLSDEAGSVKLGEIKDRLQDQARVAAEREQLQTEKSAFEQQRAQEMAASSQMSEELVQAEAQLAMIQQQYQTTDWEKFEEQDSGRAALYKQDLTNAFNNAQQQIQQVKQQQQSTMQHRMAEVKAAEEAALFEHVPAWKDNTVRMQEVGDITAMATEYGYAPNEIANVMDHRAVRMMRDLYLSKQQQAVADKNVKEVKMVPKAIRPGGTPKRVNVKKKALNETLTRAAESKDMRVKTDAVKQLLGQSGALR